MSNATIASWVADLLGPRPSLPIGWTPTHRHRKGGLYRVTGHGVYEPDRSPVTIYDDIDGTTWARPTPEFDDGRFTPL